MLKHRACWGSPNSRLLCSSFQAPDQVPTGTETLWRAEGPEPERLSWSEHQTALSRAAETPTKMRKMVFVHGLGALGDLCMEVER